MTLNLGDWHRAMGTEWFHELFEQGMEEIKEGTKTVGKETTPKVSNTAKPEGNLMEKSSTERLTK